MRPLHALMRPFARPGELQISPALRQRDASSRRGGLHQRRSRGRRCARLGRRWRCQKSEKRLLAGDEVKLQPRHFLDGQRAEERLKDVLDVEVLLDQFGTLVVSICLRLRLTASSLVYLSIRTYSN